MEVMGSRSHGLSMQEACMGDIIGAVPHLSSHRSHLHDGRRSHRLINTFHLCPSAYAASLKEHAPWLMSAPFSTKVLRVSRSPTDAAWQSRAPSSMGSCHRCWSVQLPRSSFSRAVELV
jgi:hypothetical protein